MADGALLDSRILAHLPADRNKGFSDQDYLTLIKNRIKADAIDGKEVFRDSKGEVIRDPKLVGPLALPEVLTEVFKATPNWLEKPDTKGGRGGGNSGPGAGGSGNTPVKWSEAKEAWEAQGKNINQAEFSTYVAGLAAENKAFEMDLDGGPAPAPAT